jgi:hypothetical protein
MMNNKKTGIADIATSYLKQRKDLQENIAERESRANREITGLAKNCFTGNKYIRAV